MTNEAADPTGEAQVPGRILIVDDVADNRAILGRRFERRGFAIAEADSGLGALEMIEREVFDVVLLDVMMPDINGLEVLKRIREKRSDVELPVIMVTGKTESADIVEALTAGANDYITKPVDFAVAMLRVSTQVGRRRAEERVRQANEALSRANEDLERRIAERTVELVRANKAKDEFLVIVSHELRTPLNGMIGMGQMLAKTQLTEAQQRMAQIINTSAGQLHTVVADLLDTLDLSAGGLSLQPGPVVVETLVAEAVQPAADKAAAKGLAFKHHLAADAKGVVQADGARLAQVLGKILDNAVKFTEQGEVELTVARSPADPRRLRFMVRDTGVGFDEATAARLFRPFEQADGSLTRRFGGVGLGLAICRGLVDLMGGVITAQGKPGEGAVFCVDLPLAEIAQAA